MVARLGQLAGNPALRNQLGNRGRELVKENFRVERMVETLLALYQSLLSRKAAVPTS